MITCIGFILQSRYIVHLYILRKEANVFYTLIWKAYEKIKKGSFFRFKKKQRCFSNILFQILKVKSYYNFSWIQYLSCTHMKTILNAFSLTVKYIHLECFVIVLFYFIFYLSFPPDFSIAIVQNKHKENLWAFTFN